ncbi:cytochrome B [Pararhodobacter sp.]|uniref:cytochrome B n=1 Tax=Pararhodobacter sp. TaxID=2127056 RepID=UPI002FE0AF9B
MVPGSLAGCTGPLSTLTPHGPEATAIATLWWVMLAGSALITALVLLLLALAFRARRPALPPAFWTQGLGLYFSFGVLTLLMGVTILTGDRLSGRYQPAEVTVEAIARQWQWRFRQPGPDGTPVETTGRLHIPAGVPVEVLIRTEDVIHSFWVPQLAGKLDAIPGHENRLRLIAPEAGLYQGRSAEFSGAGYVDMGFEVLAYPPDDPPAPFTDRRTDPVEAPRP